MRTTIKDIAKIVGVNVATVSRALNEKPGVSPELRRQIAKKAAEMNYLPHGQARGLVTQRTETVGLMFDIETGAFLSNPFYGEVLAGIESEMRVRNYSLMFASAADQEILSLNQLPKFAVEHRVDGILIVGSLEAHVIRLLRDVDLPFLMIDYHLPNEHIDAVVADNRRGGRLAAEHLIKLGHRRIAFVGGGPLDHGNFAERLEGYREALAAASIPYKEELVQGGAVEAGYDSMLKVLERAPDVTAVVGCNDANALGAMRAVRSRQMSIPEEISVVGFDDISAAAEAWPPLTTVRVDKRAMGRAAAQRLLQKTESKEPSPPYETVFPTEIVVRESTAAPKVKS
ncbi:MAG: LacI family DNA-binding transcriptional regulator [Kiritimatiellae bacterium]|nr:LacI family DNA-binding transcriptional regulator [Kiritimatiellia bacterium]